MRSILGELWYGNICPSCRLSVLSPLSACGKMRNRAVKNAPPSEKVVHCIELGIVCHVMHPIWMPTPKTQMP